MLRRKKTRGDGEGQLCSLCFVNTEHVLWIQHIAYVWNTTADLQQPAVCQLHHEIPKTDTNQHTARLPLAESNLKTCKTSFQELKKKVLHSKCICSLVV